MLLGVPPDGEAALVMSAAAAAGGSGGGGCGTCSGTWLLLAMAPSCACVKCVVVMPGRRVSRGAFKFMPRRRGGGKTIKFWLVGRLLGFGVVGGGCCKNGLRRQRVSLIKRLSRMHERVLRTWHASPRALPQRSQCNAGSNLLSNRRRTSRHAFSWKQTSFKSYGCLAGVLF